MSPMQQKEQATKMHEAFLLKIFNYLKLKNLLMILPNLKFKNCLFDDAQVSVNNDRTDNDKQ